MSSTATQQILLTVQSTRESAKRAEAEYDRKADRLREKAGRNIDLFGGSAVSQVADIARDSRVICDGLYAAYQTLVKMLDGQCRPLLAQEPDVSAVRAVRDLIKWLNDESEIENNFTASLNARDLGDVVGVRYIPSIENKMIQSFWETTYHALPGRADFEQAEQREANRQRQEAAAVRRAQQEEAAKKIRSEKDAYPAALEAWEAAVKEAQQQRDTMLKNLTAQERRSSENAINEKYDVILSRLREEREACQAELLKAQSALSATGFFQFSEKSRLKKQIETLTGKISDADRKLRSEQADKERELSRIATRIAQKRAEWQAAAEQAYPIPEEPCPPGMTRQQFESKKMQDAIYQTLSQHKMLTAEELFEKCPAAKTTNITRFKAILRQMDGRICTLEVARRMYYQALPEKDPEEVEKENAAYRQAILEYVRDNGKCTVGDISDGCYEVMSLSMQRLSSLVSQLYHEGKLHRTEEDRKAYYEIV